MKYYFLSDAHLGCRMIADTHAHEQKLVDWLDMAQKDATALFLLGDIFDFWFEYTYVVPKGFTRVLGKLREITEKGISVHFFVGNHDLWTFGYLQDEIGLTVHYSPETMQLGNKQFFLAHGDGLGDKSRTFSLIRVIFHNKVCQWLFRTLIPPSWGLKFGYTWSKNNRKKHEKANVGYQGEEKEPLVRFAKKHAKEHAIDYYLFGHRHILLHLMLANKSQMIILGDFMREFSYATFDGESVCLENFE